MSDRQTVIYAAARPYQAHLLRARLAEEGIPAKILNETLQVAVGEIPTGWSTAVRVTVHEEHAAKARQIALEFDRLTARRRRDPYAAEPMAWLEEDLPDWPLCPACGRPRQTACPFCETAGSDFKIVSSGKPQIEADEVATEGGPQVLVLCPTCDEPYSPVFLRICEWCGHDFGEGSELPEPAPRQPQEVNHRIMVAALGVLAVVVAMLTYLALILRR